MCFDYRTKKYDNGQLTFDGDGVYNDWVIKLSPADGSTITIPSGGGGGDKITYETETREDIEKIYSIENKTIETGRILCEDLGNYSNREDLDYNDVVFNAQIIRRTYKTTTITTPVTITKKYVNGVYDSQTEEKGTPSETTKTHDTKNFAKVELYAAGGTLELSVLGQEVHELFGVGVTTMVNTRDKNTGSLGGANTVVRKTVEMINPNFENERKTYEDFEDNRSAEDKENDQYLFAVDYESIIEIPIMVRYDDGHVLALEAKQGSAPHKIKVDIDTRWASERCNIAKAYSQFNSYVSGNVEKFWSDGGKDDYLYDKETTISTEAEGDVSEIVTGEGGVTLNVLWKSDNGGYDISRGLYFTNTNLLISQGIKVGDRFRFEGKKTSEDWVIFLCDGNSARIHTDQTSLNDLDYAEVTLTEDLVNKLRTNNTNAAMVITGYGVSLTRVSLIKK